MPTGAGVGVGSSRRAASAASDARRESGDDGVVAPSGRGPRSAPSDVPGGAAAPSAGKGSAIDATAAASSSRRGSRGRPRFGGLGERVWALDGGLEGRGVVVAGGGAEDGGGARWMRAGGGRTREVGGRIRLGGSAGLKSRATGAGAKETRGAKGLEDTGIGGAGLRSDARPRRRWTGPGSQEAGYGRQPGAPACRWWCGQESRGWGRPWTPCPAWTQQWRQRPSRRRRRVSSSSAPRSPV